MKAKKKTSTSIPMISGKGRAQKAAKASARAADAVGLTRRDTSGGKGKGKGLSGLDAAAKVLADSGKPMRARDLVAAMASKGLWKSPGGKTPHATIYAAIIREMRDKRDGARFRKAGRGMFAAAK